MYKVEVIPKRWSARRKMEIVPLPLQGEAIDAMSRNVRIEIFRLGEWRDEALLGMESGFKQRVNDPRNLIQLTLLENSLMSL